MSSQKPHPSPGVNDIKFEMKQLCPRCYLGKKGDAQRRLWWVERTQEDDKHSLGRKTVGRQSSCSAAGNEPDSVL